MASKGKSPFNPDVQIGSTESKIVVALERISEAFRTLLWEEGKAFGLSPIQVQLLIFLLHHSEEKSKVSYLALEFNLTKPTISEAIKSLEQKGLVTKKTEPQDTRSYTIHLTSKGKAVAQKSSAFADEISVPISKMKEAGKTELLINLLEIISHLNKQGVISIQRMCYSCRFYSHNSTGHYCSLLQSKLADKDIRVDCPEHEFAEV